MSHRDTNPRFLPPHALDALLTPQRAHRYREVLAQRTNRCTVVIEDCHHPHNAAAVLRTCDAVGISRVHLVTERHAFAVNRKISQGADRYLELKFHGSIRDVYAELRQAGFQIWASHLEGSQAGQAEPATVADLAKISAAAPLAVVFGNEVEGLSSTAQQEADGHFSIPMCGFSRSLNLSVAVAITLYSLRGSECGGIQAGDLTQDEQQALFELWVTRQHPQSQQVVESFEDGHGNPIDVLALPSRDPSGDASDSTERYRRRR